MVLWVHATEVQHDRIIDRSAPRERRITDSVFFVIALRNVRLALRRLFQLDAAPGYAAAIMTTFDEAVPSIDAIRHALEHYDEYVLGKGKAQKAGQFSDWTFGLEDLQDQTVFRLGELSVEVERSYNAALKAFQQLFAVFQEIHSWPEGAQVIDDW